MVGLGAQRNNGEHLVQDVVVSCERWDRSRTYEPSGGGDF